MEKKQFTTDHPYYCSSENYNSIDYSTEYESWDTFFEEMNDADKDMNLLFRYDIIANEEGRGYYGEFFYMLQRKGKFVPITVKNIRPIDIPEIKIFVAERREYLKTLWTPINN
jgi:hypothetical protein